MEVLSTVKGLFSKAVSKGRNAIGKVVDDLNKLRTRKSESEEVDE